MYTLTDNEKELFIATYFSHWGDDIKRVTMVEHDDIKEYLINDHYLYLIEK